MASIQSAPPESLRFYDFASLAGKCLTTLPFWFFGEFGPLKIVGRHPNFGPKGTPLGEDASFEP